MHFFTRKKEKSNTELVEKTILEKYNQYYRLAYSYVHNESDAFDIVQNGAYKALRSAHTLINTEYIETWLYRIMLNECFSYIKQPKFISFESMLDESKIDLSYMDEHWERIDLQRALDSLPKKDKAIIIFRYFEDMKLDEIADILGENVNTIKSRLYRGIRKLRSILSTENNQRDNNISNRIGR